MKYLAALGLSALIFLVADTASVAGLPPVWKADSVRISQDMRSKAYIAPAKVLWKSSPETSVITGEEALLSPGDGQAVLGDVSYSRMREWSFTEKGWFFYELCTPEYPEVTEVIYSNAMMRVVPLEEEYAKVTEAFLEPVAYNGNNLFWTDWDAEHMDGIDYNGLFEYLYEMRTGKDFDKTQYQDGIPGGQFEELMTAALPGTPEQLRGYAAYDAEEGSYEWISLGVGNRTLGPLTGAIPEVVGMEENGDGSVTLTVDAVCESTADDAFLTHYLTIQMDEEDQVRYLSNVVAEGQEDALPEYVYRIQR